MQQSHDARGGTWRFAGGAPPRPARTACNVRRLPASRPPHPFKHRRPQTGQRRWRGIRSLDFPRCEYHSSRRESGPSCSTSRAGSTINRGVCPSSPGGPSSASCARRRAASRSAGVTRGRPSSRTAGSRGTTPEPCPAITRAAESRGALVATRISAAAPSARCWRDRLSLLNNALPCAYSRRPINNAKTDWLSWQIYELSATARQRSGLTTTGCCLQVVPAVMALLL